MEEGQSETRPQGLRRGDLRSEKLIEEQEKLYTDGQILRFVRVRFPGNAKSFPFLIGERSLGHGQKVLAMSDRGMAVGYINSFPYELPFRRTMLPLRSIKRVATEDDIAVDLENYRRQKKAETTCKNLIERNELDMLLTHVDFTQFGKKAVFYFTAPARVDFRGMVKELVSELKMRVELRQISVRDRSASVGGIGPCGRQLCCSSFLSRYGQVNLKMAKNQNLTLNFNKLNGVCGQLKCCLQYEDEVYAHKRAKLPREGKLIVTACGDKGKVERVHLLSEQFELLTTQGVRKRYAISQFLEDEKVDFEMPRSFEHISNETSVVVGLSEDETLKAEKFEEDILRLKSETKGYAEQVFEELFGVKTFRDSEAVPSSELS